MLQTSSQINSASTHRDFESMQTGCSQKAQCDHGSLDAILQNRPIALLSVTYTLNCKTFACIRPGLYSGMTPLHSNP